MALAALSLRDRQGHDVNPGSSAAVREYLLGARADNMAYMLSAQLAAMSLSLHHGLVDRGALVRAPGFAAANRNDLATVGDLVAAAGATLHSFGLTPSGHPMRQHQELLKDLLEEANHDRGYVAPSPATCPPPVF